MEVLLGFHGDKIRVTNRDILMEWDNKQLNHLMMSPPVSSKVAGKSAGKMNVATDFHHLSMGDFIIAMFDCQVIFLRGSMHNFYDGVH